MLTDQTVIAHTRKWIIEVVIGCNFCPFAAREVKRGRIHYEVLHNGNIASCMLSLKEAFIQLNDQPGIETLFILLPFHFASFDEYLQLVDAAQTLLEEEEYEGVYQLASFHPEYLFADAEADDPANYTNRSPYPMLHLLREDSVSRAVDGYPGTDNIPARNIAYTRQKGLAYMQSLKNACMGDS